MTTKMAGKMNRISGNISFTGSLRGQFLGLLIALGPHGIGVHPQGLGHAGAEAVRLDEQRGEAPHLLHVRAHAQVSQGLDAGFPGPQLQVEDPELVADHAAAHADLLGHAVDGGIDPHARLDADDKQVEGVGETHDDLLFPPADHQLETQVGKIEPQQGQHPKDQADIWKRSRDSSAKTLSEEGQAGNAAAQSTFAPQNTAERAGCRMPALRKSFRKWDRLSAVFLGLALDRRPGPTSSGSVFHGAARLGCVAASLSGRVDHAPRFDLLDESCVLPAKFRDSSTPRAGAAASR